MRQRKKRLWFEGKANLREYMFSNDEATYVKHIIIGGGNLNGDPGFATSYGVTSRRVPRGLVFLPVKHSSLTRLYLKVLLALVFYGIFIMNGRNVEIK